MYVCVCTNMQYSVEYVNVCSSKIVFFVLMCVGTWELKTVETNKTATKSKYEHSTLNTDTL